MWDDEDSNNLLPYRVINSLIWSFRIVCYRNRDASSEKVLFVGRKKAIVDPRELRIEVGFVI